MSDIRKTPFAQPCHESWPEKSDQCGTLTHNLVTVSDCEDRGGKLVPVDVEYRSCDACQERWKKEIAYQTFCEDVGGHAALCEDNLRGEVPDDKLKQMREGQQRIDAERFKKKREALGLPPEPEVVTHCSMTACFCGECACPHCKSMDCNDPYCEYPGELAGAGEGGAC